MDLVPLVTTLYALKLYFNDRQNGILPMLSVDGHSQNFDLEFLQYVCDENHKRTVIFGVLLWNIIVASRRLSRTERNIQHVSC